MAMFGNSAKPMMDPLVQGFGTPIAQNYAPVPMPSNPEIPDSGFFSKQGGWRDVVGALGDTLAAAGGGKGVYLPQKMQQRQLEEAQKQRQADRQSDRADWLWQQQWKLNNQPPELTAYQQELKAAGIDPMSAEGQQLVRQKVQNTADPLIQVPYTDPSTGATFIRGVPASTLRGTPQALPAIGSVMSDPRGAGPGQRPFP